VLTWLEAIQSHLSLPNLISITGANPGLFKCGGGSHQGWTIYARKRGLPLSLWKKNENQIMLRCLLKHYKIRIFQVLCKNTGNSRHSREERPMVRDLVLVQCTGIYRLLGFCGITHYITKYLISRLTIYFKVDNYEKETVIFKIFITSCKSTPVSRKGWPWINV